ncbi:glycoside hydrolase family 9 protein [Flavihumibacter sp. CACIAM 22H1]|uniref:glycoside hydrolase family 9 protein n=1 Tax=Flavihumibacter sp. CACIAM 22H1 TaxID=1812911 RepID=UPI000A8785AE|nr:glycoside hydrolase family 9 protein [Flavihumibacter sp. CACIAM 22H1]
MKKILPIVFLALVFITWKAADNSTQTAWIRINQMGYLPKGSKVAVWAATTDKKLYSFQVVSAVSGKKKLQLKAGKAFGEYGPFKQSYRLDFSALQEPGRYYLEADGIRSPEFSIADTVYRGAADFCLRYMRQQRSGFNPFLQDSCHTRDGYTLYGPMPDSTYVDVVGGWHDASDYLQYSTTSANATYHLLMAYRDFPKVFKDEKLANGEDGNNNLPDVLDEAKWASIGYWKMHPKADWMFNQIADDRDHISMRLPRLDSQYGRGHERPVYFITGQPQQRGKFLNNTTGTSSTAAKFSSAFSLGARLFTQADASYSKQLQKKAISAYAFAEIKPGVTQTASVKAPYIYAEDNWVDDMELAAAELGNTDIAYSFALREKITPWLGKDTANHYQWYPFINLGHFELAKRVTGSPKDSILAFYKQGIEAVWQKARTNAFYRGVPFIWCSNNLTTSFAIQCIWYQELTGDKHYEQLAQANIDWLFGLNPWGTSMVYGLPSWGDTPVDPHSSFTHLNQYPIDGGLVDGPVYGSIYGNLIGIQLFNPDEYAGFQSGLVVYHDDYGDYSTNEPTMDGTASLIYLLAALESQFRFDKK